jgi:hypothetical protein
MDKILSAEELIRDNFWFESSYGNEYYLRELKDLNQIKDELLKM